MSHISHANTLFEFEDLSWFPDTLRQSMMDCLRFIVTMSQLYQPVIPLIREGLKQTQSTCVIDLCSGGGGSISRIEEEINLRAPAPTTFVLTDKFPNLRAFQLLRQKAKNSISYSSLSVDAAQVPESMKGFRTIFSAFHHFNRPYAKSVIQDAVHAKQGIGIFDGGEYGWAVALGLLVVHPFIFLFCTPFFKPFRLSRFIFTYVIPLIPICQIWDGVVSIIRLYRPDELLQMAMEVEPEHYVWQSGRVKNKFGIHVTYLLGYPKPT